MFEREVVGDEVFIEMEGNLKKIASDKSSLRLSKRAEALSLLNKAAEKLDGLGMYDLSESIVRVMEISAIDKVQTIQKKAEVEVVEDDLEDFLLDTQNKEEDELYDAYMLDPDVEVAVSIGDSGKDEILIPTSEQLSGLWE